MTAWSPAVPESNAPCGIMAIAWSDTSTAVVIMNYQACAQYFYMFTSPLAKAAPSHLSTLKRPRKRGAN